MNVLKILVIKTTLILMAPLHAYVTINTYELDENGRSCNGMYSC